jgi:WD repeat-containing protein 35
MKWSEDDPDMIVIMEKTKMIVFQGDIPEDPVICSGYLARFKDLEIRVITLDDLMLHPDRIEKECVIDYESKSLREVRDKIVTDGLQAGYGYTERNPHPRLWKLIANAALEELELIVAEKAFVRCGDYYGVQLVKQLQAMPDKMKARAEAAVYLNRFDEAESILREIDRKDLAIQLRKRLGDYTRVVQLLQTGGGNDTLVRESWDKIGEYYADRFKWKKAAQYFQQSKNIEKLAECYYRLDNFTELAKLRQDIPDESPLLITLAKQFESVGMVDEAVDCYLHSTRPPKEAVDCCVLLSKWVRLVFNYF